MSDHPTTGYLVRIDSDHWELYSQHGQFLTRINAGVYFACVELNVRRLMFGSYHGREAWFVLFGALTPVEPISAPESPHR